MENRKIGLWTSNFITACTAHFLMCFSYYMLMSTLPFYILERFHASKTIAGLVLSCYVISALAIRPFSGYMLDTFPRKQLYLLSFICFVSLFSGYLLAASLLIIVIIRILHGVTWGIVTTSANTLAIDIMPSEKRGEGIGYFGMTLSIAMAIGPIAGLFLYEHYSFESIFYSTIAFGLLGFLGAICIKAPRKPKVQRPPVSLDRFIMLKGIPVAFNLVLVAISYGMIIAFAAVYGKELNISNTSMFFTLLALGIGGSRVIGGKLVDRGWIHKLSLCGMTLLSASFILFTFSRSAATFFTAAFFIGFGYGILIPAFQTLFVNMASHNQRGTATSMYLTSFDLGIGTGMILAGKIASSYGFSTAFASGALFNMLAVFYYWVLSRQSYEKNKLLEKDPAAIEYKLA